MLGFLSRFVDSNDRRAPSHRASRRRGSTSLEPDMEAPLRRQRYAPLSTRFARRSGRSPASRGAVRRRAPPPRAGASTRDRQGPAPARARPPAGRHGQGPARGLRPPLARLCGARWECAHFDVQLMGGIVLHQGKIAEMKTGEGKTPRRPRSRVRPERAHRPRRPRRHGSTTTWLRPRRTPSGWAPSTTSWGLSVGIIIGGPHERGRARAYLFEPGYPRATSG